MQGAALVPALKAPLLAKKESGVVALMIPLFIKEGVAQTCSLGLRLCARLTEKPRTLKTGPRYLHQKSQLRSRPF